LPTSDHNAPCNAPRRRPFLKAHSLALLLLAALVGYAAVRLAAKPIPVTAAEEALARAAFRAGPADGRVLYRGAPALWSDASDGALPDAPPGGPLNARAAILVDAATGAVLLERDADEPIPPASMTKLVAIYTALRAAAEGRLDLDEPFEPPAEAWASAIPPGSSLMFLGPAQIVTPRDLIAGMATVSGNDAAMALAIRLSGSVDGFAREMNAEARRLGLERTGFVEPSGLSERNLTTAREFADFCVSYLLEFPDAPRALHSRTEFAFPEARHRAPGNGEPTRLQRATNRLLGVLPGCDGLKTGFIYESGYNLALTVERDGTRFVAVTMGGPGSSTAEGNRLRSEDGTRLMEWAFSRWRTARVAAAEPRSVTCWGGERGAFLAIPAYPADFTAEIAIAERAASGDYAVEVDAPRAARAPVAAGDRVGEVRYLVGGKVARRVPLVADRSVGRAAFPRRVADGAASLLVGLLDLVR